MKLSLAELNYNLGHVLHQQGDLASAAHAFQQAITLDPDFLQARHCLAVVLSEQGCDQTAAQHYRWILRRQPRPVKAYHNLGVILARQSQPDAALDCFYQILQLEPNSPAAHTGCGLVHLALKQSEQALAHFRQALRPSQQQILAFCDWAAHLTGQDELTRARQACGQFLRALLQSSDQSLPPALGHGDWSHHRSSKTSSSQMSDRENAWSNQSGVSTALQLDRNISQRVQQHLGETCLYLGDLLMRYGGDAQIRQAEAYYQQALQHQPQQLALYLKLVGCLAQQQRWNAAILLCRLGLTLYPNAASLYQNLGWLLEQQQQWAEAITCYRRAWQLVDLPGAIEPQLGPTPLPESVPESVAQAPGPTRITAVCSTLDGARQACGRYLPLEMAAGQVVTGQVVTGQTLSPGSSCPPPARLIDLQGSSGQPTYQPTCQTGDRESCQGLNCQPCLQKIVNQFSPTQLQPGVYACRADSLSSKPPAYFVAQIPAGIAQITPYQTPWLVANAVAVLTPDRVLLSDLSREYPGQLPTCRCEPTLPRLLKAGLKEPSPIAGSVAVLAGLSGHNYFHWMVDILPRLELLRQSGWADPDWLWINYSELTFQRETLEVLGISESRLLSADRWPCIQAEQLIAPAFAGHLGWPEPWALTWLRQQFLPLAASAPVRQPERLYISRSRAHHRRLLNEAALLERLQALGFVAVELESMPLAEQIALFAQAQVIVAPHGGGLTNIIFCQPGTAVIELVAPNYIRPYYWVISHHLGLHHYYVKGEPSTCPPIHQLMYPSPLLEDIWIDLEKITGLLQQLGIA